MIEVNRGKQASLSLSSLMPLCQIGRCLALLLILGSNHFHPVIHAPQSAIPFSDSLHSLHGPVTSGRELNFRRPGAKSPFVQYMQLLLLTFLFNKNMGQSCITEDFVASLAQQYSAGPMCPLGPRSPPHSRSSNHCWRKRSLPSSFPPSPQNTHYYPRQSILWSQMSCSQLPHKLSRHTRS